MSDDRMLEGRLIGLRTWNFIAAGALLMAPAAAYSQGLGILMGCVLAASVTGAWLFSTRLGIRIPTPEEIRAMKEELGE